MNVTLEVHGRDSTNEYEVDKIERITRHAERPGRPETDQPNPTERYRMTCETTTLSPPRVGESVGIHITAQSYGITGDIETVDHYVYGEVEAVGARLIVKTYERDQGGDETLHSLSRGVLPVSNDADADAEGGSA